MDVQRYRDDSMLWLYVSDIVYFIPGWRASPGCLAEEARAKEIGVPCIYEEDPPRCIVSRWYNDNCEYIPSPGNELWSLEAVIQDFIQQVGRAPRVYVAGPYTAGAYGDPCQILRNIGIGAWYAASVRHAGGSPYSPWGDSLELVTYQPIRATIPTLELEWTSNTKDGEV
jgi:hypothetical protein